MTEKAIQQEVQSPQHTPDDYHDRIDELTRRRQGPMSSGQLKRPGLLEAAKAADAILAICANSASVPRWRAAVERTRDALRAAIAEEASHAK